MMDVDPVRLGRGCGVNSREPGEASEECATGQIETEIARHVLTILSILVVGAGPRPKAQLYSVTPHYTLLTGDGVIGSIKHKGLRRRYEQSDRGGIRSDLVEKVQKIPSALEAANGPEDMTLPLFRFHRQPARHLLSDAGATGPVRPRTSSAQPHKAETAAIRLAPLCS
jgi:hypothetical protein